MIKGERAQVLEYNVGNLPVIHLKDIIERRYGFIDRNYRIPHYYLYTASSFIEDAEERFAGAEDFDFERTI